MYSSASQMRLAIFTASGSGSGCTLFNNSLKVWPSRYSIAM